MQRLVSKIETPDKKERVYRNPQKLEPPASQDLKDTEGQNEENSRSQRLSREYASEGRTTWRGAESGGSDESRRERLVVFDSFSAEDLALLFVCGRTATKSGSIEDFISFHESVPGASMGYGHWWDLQEIAISISLSRLPSRGNSVKYRDDRLSRRVNTGEGLEIYLQQGAKVSLDR
ncbi:hypothetical protein NLI96_g4078 [Meripilus lineatus]|uniref:Uncharacterized protein n=1 Tax=Meripilus lineatus TaxID=2056292 RepID=A0AAD5YG09_9APHY|nr:hypothetical protein NLI96_g4078 [Physisporinus lineatus]